MESRSESERFENGNLPRENPLVLAIIALQGLSLAYEPEEVVE